MSGAERFEYQGGELELFRHAANWKAYLRDEIAPFLGARVLEVGAGIGETARALCRGGHDRWTCLEPDPAQARIVESLVAARELPACCEARAGTIASVPDLYDSVLYVDVLEHIEDDGGELVEAARRLAPGGSLVVLAPAHNWLYSEFDRHVGHFRRYTAGALHALAPPALAHARTRYLDSAGLLASLGNRLLLRKGLPTEGQIRLWDRGLVPVSRLLDRPLGHRVGKSVLVVWRAAR